MTAYYEPAPGWDSPAAGRCRPGMVHLRDFLTYIYGADNLGCYGDRPMTGGSSPSLHRDGRAIDIGFNGILDKREDAFDFLVRHSAELGIQIVLNYKHAAGGGYRWRLARYAGDTAAGIKAYTKSGHWLHIERTNAGADDDRPIAEIVGLDPAEPAPEPPPPTSPPAPAPPTTQPNPPRPVSMNVNMTPLSRAGTPGPLGHVETMQTLLNLHVGSTIDTDGYFGPQTDKAVRGWQAWHRLTVDGLVGPQTWRSLIEAG